MGRTAKTLCAACGPLAVLEGGYPASDRSDCANQRADVGLEIAEATPAQRPEGRPGSGVGKEPLPKAKKRGFLAVS